MSRNGHVVAGGSVVLVLAGLVTGCDAPGEARDGAARMGMASAVPLESEAAPSVAAVSPEEAGRYLVAVAGCNDCHTEGYLATEGAIPESEWMKGSVVGFTGPWGTTYPSNLRLSAATMTEDQWVEMLGTRKAMPPMPWMSVAALSDADRRAMYRYLRTFEDPGEPVPANLPPGQEPTTPWIDFVPKNLPQAASPAPSAAAGGEAGG